MAWGLGNIFSFGETSKTPTYSEKLDLLNNKVVSDYNANPSADLTSYNDSYTKLANSYDSGSNSTLGMDNSTWGTLGNVAKIGTGLGELWTGYKQLGLKEDEFKYNKMDADRTYAMAKDAYDKNVARASSIGGQMNAGKVG